MFVPRHEEIVAKILTITFSKEYPQFDEYIGKLMRESNVTINPAFESQNVGTLKRVIESGLGWGFLPSLSIRKQVKMGRLNHVHLKEFHYEMEFYFYFRKGAENKALMEVFYQALQHQERV